MFSSRKKRAIIRWIKITEGGGWTYAGVNPNADGRLNKETVIQNATVAKIYQQSFGETVSKCQQPIRQMQQRDC